MACFPLHAGPPGSNKVISDFASQIVFLATLFLCHYCATQILERPVSAEIGRDAQIVGSHK